MEINRRYEDMSRLGHIEVYQQTDGDMILSICPDPDAPPSYRVSVEFCTYPGGGQSPKVRLALQNLMQAIIEENKENPQNRKS